MKLNLHLLQTAVFIGLILLAGCTVRTKTLAGGESTLQDTDWALISFADQDVPAPTVTRTSYIHFDSENGKVKGFAGCNSFFGRYTLKGDKLSLHELGSTRMTCPDIEVEKYLMGVLDNVTSYSITGDLLILYSKGTAVATFRAGYEEKPDHEIIPEGQL